MFFNKTEIVWLVFVSTIHCSRNLSPAAVTCVKVNLLIYYEFDNSMMVPPPPPPNALIGGALSPDTGWVKNMIVHY